MQLFLVLVKIISLQAVLVYLVAFKGSGRYVYTHDCSAFSPLGQRPVLMLRGKVIPNDGTARISITSLDRKYPLTCHLCIGDRIYQYGWFVHPTRETVQEEFRQYDDSDDDFSEWWQKRVNNYLLLQKRYEIPIEGVFTCLLSHDVHPATAHVGIYHPSEL